MYDNSTAIHYAAYRPPVHEVILDRFLSREKVADLGLDIGCGTGRSSLALQAYCKQVIAVDSSEHMLANASGDGAVSFVAGNGEALPLDRESVAIVTMAGSLSYMNRDSLVREINRVCIPGARIVVYDFEVNLDDIEARLNLAVNDSFDDYDHAATLGEHPGLQMQSLGQDVLEMQIEATDIAHLLLADESTARLLQEKYQSRDSFVALVADITKMRNAGSINIKIYYANYLFTGANTGGAGEG